MDGIEMDSDEATTAMRVMADAGRTLSTGWAETGTRLNALAGRLGQGELGAAYRAGYQKPAADTAAVVDRHCQEPGRLAEMGHQCVGLYLSADRNSASGFGGGQPGV